MTAARKTRRGCGCLLFVLIAAVLGGWGWFVNGNREIAEARPISGASTGRAWFDPAFVAAPVPGSVDANPYLAEGQNGTMHGDGYQSDTHLAAGPLRLPLDVRTRRAGNGLPRQCATFVYRSDGKPVSMCGGLSGFRIVLLDPNTLRALATYDLPPRPSSFEALVKRDMGIMMDDSSGGAYLFLDNHDRVVLADSKMRVQRLAAVEQGGQWHFAVDGEWDLRPHVPHACLDWNNWFPSGECDKVTTVMPDYEGRLWWTTRNGRIGIIDPQTGSVRQTALGEEIQNALAMDRDAVYVLSDHAQYAFSTHGATLMQPLWREPYDRGTARKVGSINQGSGTTPTLLGERWITFSDNADDRINIVVLRR
ncbi:MAG: hypothetical protein KGM49_13655, partial [Sphingomonadales bacterium]|nr:hypothetical protein [Sphingomonadales bacterium]